MLRALTTLGDDESTATIEMNIRYLRPVREGEIEAKASVVKRGGRIVTAEAEIQDMEGKALAWAGASFMIIKT
ncbi:MAG: PaaI family thioesterase [Candidatus Bathyarchaeia archaeon]